MQESELIAHNYYTLITRLKNDDNGQPRVFIKTIINPMIFFFENHYYF